MIKIIFKFCALPSFLFLVAMPNTKANPACERLRHELEHHCGAGIEFYAAHQNRELVIMNTPYPSLEETSGNRMICTYNSAPGLVSIHAADSHCEEAANIAGNLCFRQGFTHLMDVGIDDLTNNRLCTESLRYSPLDPRLEKSYLWGSGFMRTKYVLIVNNLEGFVERRPNPDYLGNDLTDTRVVQIKFTDHAFAGLAGILNNILIEVVPRLQCDLFASMLDKPLNNLGVIMIDELRPQVEFSLRDGGVISSSPCVEVRHFLQNFNQAVTYMSGLL